VEAHLAPEQAKAVFDVAREHFVEAVDDRDVVLGGPSFAAGGR
jgi:hypothetical protein